MKNLSKKTALDIARERWNEPDAVRIRQIIGLSRMAVELADGNNWKEDETRKAIFTVIQNLHDLTENNLARLLPRDPALPEAIATLQQIIGE